MDNRGADVLSDRIHALMVGGAHNLIELIRGRAPSDRLVASALGQDSLTVSTLRSPLAEVVASSQRRVKTTNDPCPCTCATPVATCEPIRGLSV